MLGGLAAGSLAIATLGEPAIGNVIFDLAAKVIATNSAGTVIGSNTINPGGTVTRISVAQNLSFQPTDPTRAPEPGTMALFGIGLIGIGMIGRKLKRGKRSEINL